jgi:hypothetical protein
MPLACKDATISADRENPSETSPRAETAEVELRTRLLTKT